MNFNIVTLPGDGVGPEVTAEAVKVLRAVGKKYNHTFTMNERLIGGAAIDAEGVAVSTDTIDMCRRCGGRKSS